jgi:class 3 adenylate cyclase
MLVTFDRRGAGASQREVDDVSLEKQLLDLRAVIDALGLEQFDLSGQEDGGTIAVAYAAQNPERVSRLVLHWPIISGEDVSSTGAARSLADLMRNNWSLARRAMANMVFPTGPLELQKWASDYWREAMSGEVAAKYFEWYTTEDVRENAAKVEAPTLILCRRGQRNVPVRASRTAAALIPGANLIVLDGDMGLVYADHAPALEQVRQFLDEGGYATPSAPQPPAGAVHTILFTDVEGSTSLTDRLGDTEARDLLREHERTVREALKAHGGSEVKALGDGFMTSFSSATRALECAIAMQRAFAERNESANEPILVRVGLNAGEPIAEDDPDGRSDLYGTAVNLAARITAQGKGGEILASEAVRQIVAGKKFTFADRGETALRGFEDRVHIYQVGWREED